MGSLADCGDAIEIVMFQVQDFPVVHNLCRRDVGKDRPYGRHQHRSSLRTSGELL